MSTDYTYDEQVRRDMPISITVLTSSRDNFSHILSLSSLASSQYPPPFLFCGRAKVLLAWAHGISYKESNTDYSDPENTAPRIQSNFEPEHADLIEGQRRKQKRKELKTKRMITASLGWLLMAYMVYLMIVTARITPRVWDPYEVLGVSRSADEKAIKSHYRRLSVTYHPDKRQPDPSKNETIDSINDEWVDITKAFKTLTDEEIRNNYLQYGHPDGKQSFSIGIALPQFIITEGNGKYVLLLYGALLGVLLPYLVGKWWYGTQRLTREKVLVSTAGKLFREYKEDMETGNVINAISAGDEYHDIFKGNRADAGLNTLERKILAPGKSSRLACGMSDKDRAQLQDLDEGVRRKTMALFWAYLGRVELDDKSLNSEKYEIAPTALSIWESFLAINLAYLNTKPLLSTLNARQHLIQALAPGSSPLLQLPNMNTEAIEALEGADARKHLSIQQFMSIPDQERRKQLVSSGILKEGQYKAAVKTASQLPLFAIEKAFFKVQGERHIIANSLVVLVVKFRVIPPGTKNIPPINEKDLLDKDPPEGSKASQEPEEAKIQPPLAHAPYLARDNSPRWYLFLSEPKGQKLAVPPSATPITTFTKPIFNEQGEPTFNMQTFKMQFGAPPQVGTYAFMMHLVCDSYVGFDYQQEITMTVADPAKAEEIDDEDEISEPEEGAHQTNRLPSLGDSTDQCLDTLAGQMAALKGGSTSPTTPKKPRRPRAPIEEDDSGSDTEGDEDAETESETDTDTDTDEE
jgi:translocation protein SEC63